MQEVTDELLALRNGSDEKASGPAHPAAMAFIVREMAALDAVLRAQPVTPTPDYAPLDDFFRRVISG